MPQSVTVSRVPPRALALYLGALCSVVLVAGWVVTVAAQRGHAPAKATVGGLDVGGMPRQAVELQVASLASRFAATAISIDTGDGVLATTAADLGVSIDQAATVADVMAAGRGVPVVGWPFEAFAAHDIDPTLVVDEVVITNTVADLERQAGRPPVEPSLTVANNQLVAVAGQSGKSLDPADVAEAVTGLEFSVEPITIEVPLSQRQPTHTLDEVIALADEGNALTEAGLPVRAGGADTILTPAQLRRWLEVVETGQGLALSMDLGFADYELDKIMAGARTDPVNARFEVVDGAPVIIPSVDGIECCAIGGAEGVWAALQARDTSTPVELPLQVAEPLISTEFAERLGIIQPVASFTTQHRAGEPRVNNIHRIADLLRGVVIPPTGTLSLNGQVGRRTVENGFVDAPVIKDGRLESDIGGGVSQFATTLFNAAFFAGLELTEYQSHSLYISRYPFGREATVNWPDPDLKITNNTPFGILVWPTYTDTEITVTLYSTPTVLAVEQGAQQGFLGGESCVDVRTERIITAFDLSVKVDTVKARYRAIEGLNCGDPLPPGVSLQRIPGVAPVAPPASAGTGTMPTDPPPSTTAG